jgi:chromosome segregation ATPase
MITGRQVLASVDQALNEAHGKVNNVEDQIEAINRKLRDDQTARTENYRELARIRLGILADHGIVQHLDDVEKQVIALLSERQQALESLLKQIKDLENMLKAIEVERQQQAEQLEAAAAAIDSAEARTQKRLDAEPAYQEQRAITEDAERKAQHAREKSVRSDEERQNKGHAYQQDVLFMYLWDRHYGLPEYKANPLVRWLDGKVARLIGFADARANYSRLNEIPERLHEHAESLEKVAIEEFEALRALDTSARETDGIPALEQKMDDEQAILDSIDQRIDQARQNLQSLTSQKAKFATSDDEYSNKAIHYLANEYQRDDLMELRRDAMMTPLPDDDIIVSRLMTNETNQRELEASISGLREMIKQNQTKLNELEELRRDFKRNRFDHPGSTFSDKAMILMMLGQLMNGMMDRRTFWKVLKQQQHYRPQYSDPTFGSGGFGRGTVWNGGLGGLGGVLGGVLGGGGRRRGGFGGGLGGGSSSRGGGGGFRTGGGF